MLYADDANIVSKSGERLANKMTVIMAGSAAAGLTVSEMKTATILLQTPNRVHRISPLVIRAAGQRYNQTMQFLYLSGLVLANADIMPEIQRRARFAGACYNRFKRELYGVEDAPLTLKVSTLNAEVMETLLYACVT